MENANLCICCGVVIPEGLLVCRACEVGETGTLKYEKVKKELLALDYGFDEVRGNTVYKTITGMFKITGYKGGVDLLTAEEATRFILEKRI